MTHTKGTEEECFTALGSFTEKVPAIPCVKELPRPQVFSCYPVLVLLLPSENKQQQVSINSAL